MFSYDKTYIESNLLGPGDRRSFKILSSSLEKCYQKLLWRSQKARRHFKGLGMKCQGKLLIFLNCAPQRCFGITYVITIAQESKNVCFDEITKKPADNIFHTSVRAEAWGSGGRVARPRAEPRRFPCVANTYVIHYVKGVELFKYTLNWGFNKV